MRRGWLVCLDATQTGDVTRTAIVWSYDEIQASASTVSIADGLLFVADHAGRIRCLDPETGGLYWVHDTGGLIWGSTLAADGKLYVGTGRALLWVLAASPKPQVVSRIRMPDPIFTTPVAANGVLYVATHRHLYAVAEQGERLHPPAQP
jgi:outer membrane protein assembly factor BamB